MTGYTTRVCCCPECGADLDDEGFAFWCPSCQQPQPFNAVILPGDLDDDPERGTDD